MNQAKPADRTGMHDPFLILAPDGRDAEVIALVLAEAGLVARLCPDLQAICDSMDENVSGLILSEGALLDRIEKLAACLAQQPPWSDLPILILTTRGQRASSKARRNLFQGLGNVTLLDRPLHAETLQSAAQAAVRARQRQYRTRMYLEEIARANSLLEQRVAERTRDLQTEMKERLKAEEALRHSHKLEAIGQLTGGIAHDFNNMLQIILGNLEALYDKLGVQEDLYRHIRMAADAGERAAVLTQRLLTFARRQALIPQQLDMNGLVQTMRPLLERSITGNIKLQIGLAQDLWPTWADANQVESALLNLVINARDAMPSGGSLRIETANTVLNEVPSARGLDFRPGEYVQLRVTDMGTGMTPEVLERAFDPFFTTKPVGQGTGLGLSQIYGFAQQSGGLANIDSEPGQGTAVSLYLPRCEAQIPAATKSDHLLVAETSGSDGETILVVEDEFLVLMLWAETLQERGYRVLQAPDADTALGMLHADPSIDLLVTDIGLPGMNGRELAEIAWALRSDLKVLFLTGYAHRDDQHRRDFGTDAKVLTKPVPPAVLLTAVRAILDEL